MNTDLLGFVLGCLGQRRYKLTEIAQGTGVPYETLKKIANGSTPNPGVRHVQRLADFFSAREAGKPPAEPPHSPLRDDTGLGCAQLRGQGAGQEVCDAA